MATLEVQKQNLETQIKSEVKSAKSSIEKTAAGYKRTPQTFTVESEPVSKTEINKSKSQARKVETWRSEALADVKKQEKASLADVQKQYTAAKNAPVEYDTTGLSSEEIKILKDYGVDEINRRRQLEADIQYASAVQASEKEMKKDYVKVAGNQWVSKDQYNSLDKSDKELLQKIGVTQLQKVLSSRYDAEMAQIESDYGMTDYQRKTFEALPTVEAKNNYLNMLSGMNQALAVSQFGLDIIKAAKEASKFESENFKIADGVYLPNTVKEDWGKLTEPQKKEFIDTGTFTAEDYYKIDTPTGTVDISKSEWEEKDSFDQLSMILGKVPSAAEVEQYARYQSGGEPPRFVAPKEEEYTGVYDWPVISQLTWIGDKVAKGIEQFVLGTELIIPGTQSDYEAWWQGTRSAAGSALRDYAVKLYPGNDWVQKSGLLGAELSGFPAIRSVSDVVSLKDISLGEWGTTALTAVFAGTLARGGFKLASRGAPISASLLKIERPIISLRSPVTGLTIKSPLAASFRSPITFKIGSGLEAAGLSKTIGKATFKSGAALKELTSATKAASKLNITSPGFLKAASRLDQARVATQALDTKFANSLQGLSLTTKQIRLLEKASGYKGLGTNLAHLNVTGIELSKAFKTLNKEIPGTIGYSKALTEYSNRLYKSQAASEQFQNFLAPRYTMAPSNRWSGIIQGAESEVSRAKGYLAKTEEKLKANPTNSSYKQWAEEARETMGIAENQLADLQSSMKAGFNPPEAVSYNMRWEMGPGGEYLQKGGKSTGPTLTPNQYQLENWKPAWSKWEAQRTGRPGPTSLRDLYKAEEDSIFGLEKALGERSLTRGYRIATPERLKIRTPGLTYAEPEVAAGWNLLAPVELPTKQLVSTPKYPSSPRIDPFKAPRVIPGPKSAGLSKIGAAGLVLPRMDGSTSQNIGPSGETTEGMEGYESRVSPYPSTIKEMVTGTSEEITSVPQRILGVVPQTAAQVNATVLAQTGPLTSAQINDLTSSLSEVKVQNLTGPEVEGLVQSLVESLTETKTSTETKTKTSTQTKPRGFFFILPAQSKKKLDDSDITPGTIVWHGGLYWNIVPPPYEKRYSSKTPPPGARYTNITGKGMAKKTLQMIGGVAPKTAYVRLGFMDVKITKGSTKIEFIPTSRGKKSSGSQVLSNIRVKNLSTKRPKSSNLRKLSERKDLAGFSMVRI